MIGKVLGNRYQLLERLGGGGMAVVYKAKDTFLNRMVTVKILRSEYASDEEFVARFRKEAQAVARLSHPNIVNIHDVGAEGEVYYLVMEFVDGQDLKTFIKKHAPVPPEKALPILQQVASALAHAHKNNIVHRDVKPHNIMMTADGRAKLADFGIARETSAATITYTDTIMGSVHYISPEQARGEAAGPRSDIYSLGVVAYELLTGDLPFTGDTPIGIAMQHVQDEPHLLQDINPSISKSLSAIIARSLEKRVGDRFQSAEEFSQALKTGLMVKVKQREPVSRSLADTQVISRKEPAKRKDYTENKGLVHRVKRKYIAAGIALGIIVLSAIVFIAFHNYINTPDVEVPGVTGMTVEQARSTLEGKKLKMETAGEEFSDEFKKGTVIRQNIGPDDPPVKPGRVISVVVSKGSDLKEVPGLTGMTESEAMAILAAENLRLDSDIKKEYHSEVEDGRIISQSPGKGEQVKSGGTIKITVSMGPAPKLAQVPDMLGRTEDDAKALILENGLQLDGNVVWEKSTAVLNGRVIRQSPEPGVEVKEGSKVSLVISNGPGPGVGRISVDLSSFIPDDNEEHKVEIVVEDAADTRTEYVNTHIYDPGERLARNVSYQGNATIRVYIDDKLIDEKRVS